MSTKTRALVIAPESLTAEALDAVSRDLFNLHAQIFDGVSAEAFRSYVVEPDADLTRIARFQDAQGSDIGYAAVHAYLVEGDQGDELLVLRAEAGMLPGWRGRSLAAGFITRELLKARVRYWGMRAFYMGAFIHPSAYNAFLNRTPTLRPSPGKPYTAAELALIDRVAPRFGMEAEDGKPSYVRRVGWVTRHDRSCSAALQSESGQFFAEQNPWYNEGYGLLTLASGDLSDFLITLGSVLRYRARKLARRLPLPVTQPLAAARSIGRDL